nr:hypothetical protein [Tanacetum cinerariifolium]
MGGSSSKQHTHQPTSPITEGFLTEKEYQQLLQDKELLREILEEQARAEKDFEERIKKEQAEDELFRLEFRVQSVTPPDRAWTEYGSGEYQQLLQDEELLRETLEEQARAEKDFEERIKKEQAEDELFRLEFGVQSVTPPDRAWTEYGSGGVTLLSISSTKHKERPLR